MTNPNLSYILLISDRSGSVATMQTEMENALNSFIAEQRKVDGEAVVTLVEFDNEYNTVFENIDINDAPQYTLVPRGTTALLDAWGRAVTEAGAYLASLDEADRPSSVTVVISTDGAENASKEWTAEAVRKLTEQQERDYSWNFIFLAANQDAIAVGQQYGIAAGSALTYGGTGKSAVASMAAASGLVTARRGGDRSAVFTDADRDAAK